MKARPLHALVATLATIVTLGLFVSLASGDKNASNASVWEEANPVMPLADPPLGVPVNWDEMDSPPTPETVRLGRWLFYDARLSIDNTVSCATCHRPEFGFSEPIPVSIGVDGQKGTRKAPTVINLVETVHPFFFWDGRADSLEDQAIGPIVNPIEMGRVDHDSMIESLSEIQGYKPYFKQAFGDETITLDRVARAIADYERTRLSGNSPFDRWRDDPDPEDAGVSLEEDSEADAAFDELFGADEPEEEPQDKPANPFSDGKHVSKEVKWGHALFFGKAACNQCHFGYNFTDTQFHNLGVGWDPEKETFSDWGRFEVTGKEEDRGAFKTPGLRELPLRAPYMHDGSIETLREVVVLYNEGGEKNPWLSPMIKPLNLTDEEIDAIVAFMESLQGEGWQDTAPRAFPQ